MTPEILGKDLKDAAKDTAAALKDSAVAAAHAAKGVGQDALHDLKDRAADLKSRAADTTENLREQAQDRIAAAGETLADGSDRLAKSLRQAASDDKSPLRAQVLNTVAGGVSDVSDTLRNKSLGTLVADVQGFARRNPAVFVAGAAIAGFALARVLRSSTPTPNTAQSTSSDIENAFAKTIREAQTDPHS